MRAKLNDSVIYIQYEDLPKYKKGGSIVRNSYFWALKSIACKSGFNSDWEFDSEVWIALCRILLSFSESGYLGYNETNLEFPTDVSIPDVIRAVSTWS